MKDIKDFENRIICGDCLEIMGDLPNDSIDLVLTDPPYATKYIPLYGRMASRMETRLKEGKLLLTLVGHYALDKIIPEMSQYLNYYWIGGMPNSMGCVARNFSRQIMCGWKPVLWFVRGEPLDHQFVFDMFKSKNVFDRLHKWQQPVEWFEYYIEKLTKKGDVVLDPFSGAGSVSVACRKLNRRYIGIEINPDYCKMARQRLANIPNRLDSHGDASHLPKPEGMGMVTTTLKGKED